MFMLFEGSTGEIISLEEFMLTESVRITPIDFGTDIENRSNQEIIDSNGSGYTFLRIAGVDYMVYALGNGEVGFASNQTPTPTNNIKNYSDSPTNANQAIRVFGSILYVVVKLVRRLHIKTIRFSAASTKLGRAYKTMTRNKLLMDDLLLRGVTFDRFDGEWFVFNVN